MESGIEPAPASLSRSKRRGAVLIDLDGTLLDTAPEIAQGVNRMLADYSLAPMELGHIRRLIGGGINNLLRQVLDQAQQSDAATRAEAVARFDGHYADVIGTMAQAYPGVVAGLDGLLEGGWKLGCVTNKSQRFVTPLLDRTGLSKYFGCVVCGDTLSTMKPSAAPLLHACRALATDPAHSCMVGDSMHDVGAARAAGMRAYLVPYGYRGQDDLATLLDVDLISGLDQLPALLAARQLEA